MSHLKSKSRLFPVSWRDFLTFTVIFACAVGLCAVLRVAESSDGFAFPVFVLAVLLISRFTTGYLFGILAALFSVIGINYIFTYPYWEFNFTIAGYPLTFLTMLGVSLITCTMTTKIKEQERLRIESEKEKMRANLLRSVSHDIRTPLTSIMGATSAVLETPDLSPEEQRAFLEDAREEAQWLIRLVENLLSITRMGDDNAQLTKQEEAAEEILGETARKFRKRFPAIQITVSVPDELLLVPMDAILIEQVLSNLLENAATHGETTTKIQLSVRQEAENGLDLEGRAGQRRNPADPPPLLQVLQRLETEKYLAVGDQLLGGLAEGVKVHPLLQQLGTADGDDAAANRDVLRVDDPALQLGVLLADHPQHVTGAA